MFVPIYIHTHNGLRTIDSRYVELARDRRAVAGGSSSAGSSCRARCPGFLLGLRFAVTGAWLSLVVVEQINATSGIGYMMELARTYGQTDIIIVGLVAVRRARPALRRAVRLIERRALSWRRTLAA